MSGIMLTLTPQEVGMRLARIMKQRGTAAVVRETGQSLERLTQMVELKTPFNRRVLRYLSLRREEVYHPQPKGLQGDFETS